MSAQAGFLIVAGAVWSALFILLAGAVIWAIREGGAALSAEHRAARAAARRQRQLPAPAVEEPLPELEAAPPEAPPVLAPAPSTGEDAGPNRRVPPLPGYSLQATQAEVQDLLAPARRAPDDVQSDAEAGSLEAEDEIAPSSSLPE